MGFVKFSLFAVALVTLVDVSTALKIDPWMLKRRTHLENLDKLQSHPQCRKYFNIPQVEEYLELSFASYYGDHMVLHYGKRNNIWGYAGVMGDKVTVKLSGPEPTVTMTTTVIKQEVTGKLVWMVTLPPVHDHGPFNITASSSEADIALTDVLFGDVWLCSGQSNMQFTLSMVFNSSEEVADAVNYPQIRLFTAALRWSNKTEYDLLQVEEIWSVPNKDSVGHSDWSYFSAVCWLYGKYLYQHLKYPIGLIATSWGGTPIEAWSSQEAMDICEPEEGQIIRPSYGAAPQNTPTQLWKSMIHPFLNLTITGAIWYQGEANAGGDSDIYKCRFAVMINDWRKKFSASSDTDPMFPFGFVQLAPWRQGDIVTGFPELRWHQTIDFGYVPNAQLKNVFMAVTIDLPDFTSPYNSIHPRDKQDVASRLALSGLSVAYNMSMGNFKGPMVSAYYIDIGYFTLRLEMDMGGITVRSNNGFELCCSRNNQSKCDGSDSKWVATPITAHDDHSVTLSYKDGCANMWVMGYRYAWRESPCAFKQCAVYGGMNDLPMPPYITYGLIGHTPRDLGIY